MSVNEEDDTVSNIYPTLYKIDSKGKIREWFMEVQGSQYRTYSGLEHGKQVISEWHKAEAKNTGKANATTDEQQAHAEVEAKYKHQLDRKYRKDVGAVKELHYTQPMLAGDWNKRKAKVKFPVWTQPKLDGIRCIARQDGLWTRSGKRIVSCSILKRPSPQPLP